MTTIYLPLYGQFKSIAGAGNSQIVALLTDKESGNSTVWALDVKALFDANTKTQREESCVSISLDAVSQDDDVVRVLASETSSFVVSKNAVYKIDVKDNNLDKVLSVADIDFVEIIQDTELAIIADNTLHIYAPKKSKYASEQKIALSKSQGNVTAFAVSTDGLRIAVGYDSGMVEMFHRKSAGVDFASVQISGDTGATNPMQMHKDGSVLNLTIIRYDDNKEYVVSFGSDRKAMQARVDACVPDVRADNGLHEGFVTGVVSHANTGRFYTVSQDGQAKAWINTRKKQPPQTVDLTANIQSATMVQFCLDSDKSKKEKKYLVVAGGTGLDTSLSLCRIEEATDDNPTGGQIGTSEFSVNIGANWFKYYKNGNPKNSTEEVTEIQSSIISTISQWGYRFLDSLVEFASEDMDTEVQKEAIEAIGGNGHPSAPYKLMDILESVSEEEVLSLAVEKLFALQTDLSTVEKVIEIAENNDAEDLFALAFAQLQKMAQANREALVFLEEQVIDDGHQIRAEKAYEILSGVDSSIHSVEVALQNSNLTERALRDLYHKPSVGEGSFLHTPEGQVIVSTYLQDENSTYRDIAKQLLLLQNADLAEFARSFDESLHHDLFITETNSSGSTDEETPEQPESTESVKTKNKLHKKCFDILDALCSNKYEDISSFGCLLATRLGSEDYLSAQLMFMTSTDDSVRENAIQGLGILKSPLSEAGLIKIFCYDDNENLRDLAYAACNLEPLDKIQKAMHSSHENIRGRVVTELVQLFSNKKTKSAAKELLVQMISAETDWTVRDQLWTAFAQHSVLGNTKQMLIALATNPNSYVRQTVRENVQNILKNHGWDSDLLEAILAVDSISEVLRCFRDLLWDRSKNLQAHTMDMVKIAMQHNHASIRELGLSFIQKEVSRFTDAETDEVSGKWSKEVVNSLGNVMMEIATGNTNEDLRAQAFTVSASLFNFMQSKKIHDAKTTKFAEKFFTESVQSSFENVQNLAIQTLGTDPSGWRLKLLEKAIKDEKAHIRATAASILIQHGLLSEIKDLLKSSDVNLQIRAIQHLCKIGNDDGIAKMKSILDEKPPQKENKLYFVNNAFADAKFANDYSQWETNLIWILSSAIELRSAKILPSVRSIIEHADTYTEKTRKLAIEALAMCMDTDNKKDIELLASCQSGSHEVATAAGIALTRVGVKTALKSVWNNLSNQLKFEMIFALEDQSYITSSIAESSEFAREMIQGFVLQSLVRGGDFAFLSDGLVSTNKELVLFCGRCLEGITEKEDVLALMQRELNEWDVIQLQQYSAPELSDYYYAYIDEVTAYYSFVDLKDIAKRKKQITIEEWSLVARLLAHADPRVRSMVAGLFYQFRLQGLSDANFRTQLIVLSTRYLSGKAKFGKITVQKDEALSMAYNVYQRLVVDTEIDSSVRASALYSYVQGAQQKGLKTRVCLQLQNLLLDETMANSAFGYLWCNRETFGLNVQKELIPVLLRSPKEEVQKMGLALMVHDNSIDTLQKIACEDRREISLFACREYITLTDANRVQDLMRDCVRVLQDESRDIVDFSYTSVCHDDMKCVNLVKDTKTTAATLGTAFQALQQTYADARKKFLNVAMGAKNSAVQSEVFAIIVQMYNALRDAEGDHTKELNSLLDMMKKGLNTADKDLKNEVIEILGANGVIDVLDEVLRLAKTSTDSTQDTYYQALVNICDKTRNPDGTLSAKVSKVAPTLVERWFTDPTNSTQKYSLINALRSIQDRSIADSLMHRLENYGSDYQIRRLLVTLSGYDTVPPVKWDGLSTEEKQRYQAQRYDDALIAKLGEYYLNNALFSDYNLSQYIAQSIVLGDALLDHVVDVCKLPNAKNCNDIRYSVLRAISTRLQHRKSLDGKRLQKVLIPILEGLLTHKDKKTALYAAESLSACGNGAGFKVLLDVATNPKMDSSDRVLAFTGVGRLDNPLGLPVLLSIAGYNEYFELLPVEMRREQNEYIQGAALRAFSSLQKSKDAEVLLQILLTNFMSANSYKRNGALQALAHFGKQGRDILQANYKKVSSEFRRSVVDALAQDSSNTAWLQEMLVFECKNNNTAYMSIYNILKSRDENDLYADITCYKNGCGFEKVYSEITRKADESTLLELSQHAFLANDTVYTRFFDALINPTVQQQLGRKQSYPQQIIFASVQKQLDLAQKLDNTWSTRMELVEYCLPVANASIGKIDKSIVGVVQSCQKAWAALYDAKQKGYTQDCDITKIEDIWMRLFSLAGDIAEKEILSCLQTKGIPGSIVVALLKNVVENTKSRPALESLLSHKDVTVRATAANLLKNVSLDSVTPVVTDVSSMFWLAKSTSALIQEVKKGSVLAIHTLARHGKLDDLMGALSTVSAENQTQIINAIAVLGTKEALEALEGAPKKSSKTLQAELKKAIERCEYRIAQHAKFAKNKHF